MWESVDGPQVLRAQGRGVQPHGRARHSGFYSPGDHQPLDDRSRGTQSYVSVRFKERWVPKVYPAVCNKNQK